MTLSQQCPPGRLPVYILYIYRWPANVSFLMRACPPVDVVIRESHERRRSRGRKAVPLRSLRNEMRLHATSRTACFCLSVCFCVPRMSTLPRLLTYAPVRHLCLPAVVLLSGRRLRCACAASKNMGSCLEQSDINIRAAHTQWTKCGSELCMTCIASHG